MRNSKLHLLLCGAILTASMTGQIMAANYTTSDAGTVTYNETTKTYTASYNQAIANKEYTIMVVKGSKIGDSYQYAVSPDTLLYIGQATASADGRILFDFLPKDVTDSVVLLGGTFADGISPKVLGTLLEVSESGGDSGDSGDSGNTGGGSGDSGDSGNTGGGSGDSDDSGNTGGGSGDSGNTDSGSTSNGDETSNITVPATKGEDGSFSSNLSNRDGEKLVDTAKQNDGAPVIISPEVDKNVDKVTVSIPSGAINGIGSQTSSDVVVSTPVGDVVLNNNTLNELASTKQDVSVTVEETAPGQVEITVGSNGMAVDELSGGLTVVLPVKDKANPSLVAVKVNPDGTEEIIVQSAVTNRGMTVSLKGSSTIKVVDNTKIFTDVGTHWAKNNIQFVTARGIFGGTGPNTFAPNAGTTRGMLVTVLHNLHGVEYTGKTDSFTDVSAKDWFAKGANWAAANHIVSGMGNGLFAPNSDVTREQTAVILYGYARMIGLDTAGRSSLARFHDANSVSSWAADAVKWAVHSGLISGMPGDLLAPQGTTTRAEMATIMRKFVEFSLN